MPSSCPAGAEVGFARPPSLDDKCHLLTRSKGSPAELWRPWLFLPQHYWVFLWLLLLSIAFLLLVRVLELQRLQPAASPKA